MTKVSLKEIVGGGYKQFWNFKGRYKVVKGGRASKKSTTTALWIIYNMMKLKGANTLIIRKSYNTHQQSTYAQLKWAIRALGVSHLWSFKQSPLEMTYIPYNTKIIFRGLDDAMSLTSITVDEGHLCFAWLEECYQIESEDDFNKLDLSIRGRLPDHLFHQLILTFNPWSSKHWLKARFFDRKDEDVLAITTNYLTNEFLSESDVRIFEKMKEQNPRRYSVEGLGEWGVSEGLVYQNWTEEAFDIQPLLKNPNYTTAFGMDFGYTHPSTLICSLVNEEEKTIHIFDEHYERGMTNNDIAKMLQYKGYMKETIYADSAEPKSIEELRRLGCNRIRPAEKGSDSILNGIQYIQQYKVIVHPKCENTIYELSNYTWGYDRNGQLTGKPVDDYNHILDALRYSMAAVKKKKKLTSFNKSVLGL